MYNTFKNEWYTKTFAEIKYMYFLIKDGQLLKN